jgi:hypothetical protein
VIADEVAAVFGEIGYAQHRRATVQAVRHERRPRIAVGRQRGQRAGVRRCGDGARLFRRRRPGGIGDWAKGRRDRWGIARVTVIAGRHAGTLHANRQPNFLLKSSFVCNNQLKVVHLQSSTLIFH